MARDVSAALDMTKRKRSRELGVWILEIVGLFGAWDLDFGIFRNPSKRCLDCRST